MAFQPGQSGNPSGRKALTLSQKKALKLLQKGSPRAAQRLLELVESADEGVAMNAAKAVLAKTLADMKALEVDARHTHEHSGLSPARRREILDALREASAPETTH